jgi:hypothetical protein
MKRLNLAGLPIQIRELITMDFTRENPCPPPGVPLRDASPPKPVPAASSPLGSPTAEPCMSNSHPGSKEAAATGRESNGRFAKNNRGGPGNPFARQIAAFRACLINSVTQDDFKAIVERLVEEARYGDLQAIKLLFLYLLGAPKPVIEPDELDLHEMRLANQTALAAEALQQAAAAKPPASGAPSPPDGLDERPAAAEPPPPAAAPSANGENREPCPPTTGQAPSPNRVSEVSEAGKPSRPPSPNRANGERAAGVSKNRPSPNGPNGARKPEPNCGESPGRQAADEKRT